MKIKIIKPYPDKELDRIIFKGDELTVTKERGKHLISLGYAMEAPEASIVNEGKPSKVPGAMKKRRDGD